MWSYCLCLGASAHVDVGFACAWHIDAGIHVTGLVQGPRR